MEGFSFFFFWGGGGPRFYMRAVNGAEPYLPSSNASPSNLFGSLEIAGLAFLMRDA